MNKNYKHAVTKKSPLRDLGVKHMAFTAIFLVAATAAMAQPNPPSDPTGNPVPLGQIAGFLLIVAGFFLVKYKTNDKNGIN